MALSVDALLASGDSSSEDGLDEPVKDITNTSVHDDDDGVSDVSVDQASDTAGGNEASRLDELLAAGDSSSDDEDFSHDSGAALAAPSPESTCETRGELPAQGRDDIEAFVRAPFDWCLAHEKALLSADAGTAAESEERTDPFASEAAQAKAAAAMVQTASCPELKRMLQQEFGLPTCVVSSRFVGVGTLRGAVVLLDPKTQDVTPDPPVLSPPDEAVAVTSAAFSPDGSSMLVGHKNGQLVLWDLGAQKVVDVVRDVHTSAVISVAFWRTNGQFALSSDAEGNAFLLKFTSTAFGRRDCLRQLLLEQSSGMGVVLRISPLPAAPNVADSHGFVALCATNATVLLTLFPNVQLLQKMQYQTKDTVPAASRVPDAVWMRAEQGSPQLCVAFGQTIHIMRVSLRSEQLKEEFKISLAHRYTWPCPIQSIVAFNESVLAILDNTNRLSIVQLPLSSDDKGQQALVPIHSEDVTSWSVVYHTNTSLDNSKEARSHHLALAVTRGPSRTLYVCGMKEVRKMQIHRWNKHIEEMVGRNRWTGALDTLLALHHGQLPPLLDFPVSTSARHAAVGSSATQFIETYLVSRLQQDTARAQVRSMCFMSVNACVEMGLWSVLYKTAFECFKAAGHMNIYCNTLEPFIVKGRIPRAHMDSEVLSSILQSYAVPLMEEEQLATQHLKRAQSTGADDGAQSLPLVNDCDHHFSLFPVARRLQQFVLYVDVLQLNLDMAIRLFTAHRLWTALVHLYCALSDYISPLELLVGECTSLTKRCTAQSEAARSLGEAPLLQFHLVRKLFFFLHRCFELRLFPLDAKEEGPGMVAPTANAIWDLLHSIFKPNADLGSPPPMFSRLLRLSPAGFFGALAALYATPASGRAVQSLGRDKGKWLPGSNGSLSLETLFESIEAAVELCRQEAKDGPLTPQCESEFLWFVARAVARAKLTVPSSRCTELVEHLLATKRPSSEDHITWHTPEEAQQLLIGVLAAQDHIDKDQQDAFVSKATQHCFFGVAAWLHEECGEYERALDCRMRDEELREGIFEHHISMLAEHSHDPVRSAALVEAALQRLPRLVAIDRDRCAAMICEQFTMMADYESVLAHLESFPEIQLQFLETLLTKHRNSPWRSSEEALKFFDTHVVRYVGLLCEQQPGDVLAFLMENEALPLRECLDLCRKHSVTDASVYLLERTGNFEAVLELVLLDYKAALDSLNTAFTVGRSTCVVRARKRLETKTPARTHAEDESKVEEPPWYDGFPDGQRCVDLLESVSGLSSRNSNLMTVKQLEELWFGILGSTVRWQEKASVGRESSKWLAGLAMAFGELASQAMVGVLAYLSLPQSLQRICKDFGSSSLGIWKDSLQRMLSGLAFQQGLLRAANAVAAQDVVKPFTRVKGIGSHGVRVNPEDTGRDVAVKVRLCKSARGRS